MLSGGVERDWWYERVKDNAPTARNKSMICKSNQWDGFYMTCTVLINVEYNEERMRIVIKLLVLKYFNKGLLVKMG